MIASTGPCSLFLLLVGTCGSLAPAAAEAGKPAAAETLPELQRRIAGHLAQPRFAAAQWGVKVLSLDTRATLFETNASKLLKPASNAKLFVGALALDRLGPDYRIRTSFLARARPGPDGAVHGDLIVYGRGDFTLAARFNDGDHARSLEPAVAALLAAGIRRVDGDLVGDESYFRGPPFGSSWAWDDLQNYYGAEVSALTQEDNVVDLVFKSGARPGDPCEVTAKPPAPFLTFVNRSHTVAAGGPRRLSLYRPLDSNTVYVSGSLPAGTNWTDAISVHHPALWFVTRLKETLERRGVGVSGRPRTVNWLDREADRPDPAGLVEVASIESRPLSEMLPKMLKPSQNLYAQLLLLQVGRRVPDNPAETTEETGIAQLNRFARETGIRTGDLYFDEGSGLSRSALVTPNAIVQLLVYMDRHRAGRMYREALPVAGVDGSLRSRMKGTAAEGNIRAKTGTIACVQTLSGYVTTASRERLAFSFMLNACDDPGHSARDDLDPLAVWLAEFKGRSSASP